MSILLKCGRLYSSANFVGNIPLGESEIRPNL